MTRKADGIRRRWCKPSRPASGRALMGHKTQNHKTEVRKMQLYINDAPMGECKSYEQVREARRPGWLFRMETGLNLFIRFDEIYSFTSCGELRIIEKNA